MTEHLDPDIAAMNLSTGEKDGLQVFLNYSTAFEKHREMQFSDSAESYPQAIATLSAVLAHVADEEPRTLAVIACAFADDQLKEMFGREVPDSVPGGRSALLSGFGPLARLSQRIQMAYAFGWLSSDLLTELNHLRTIRNAISHRWDLQLLEAKLSELIGRQQHKIENYLGNGICLPENLAASLDEIQKFRVRLVWLLGRLTYESHLWVPALKQKLSPTKILYGSHPPAMLSQVSATCLSITRQRILRLEG